MARPIRLPYWDALTIVEEAAVQERQLYLAKSAPPVEPRMIAYLRGEQR